MTLSLYRICRSYKLTALFHSYYYLLGVLNYVGTAFSSKISACNADSVQCNSEVTDSVSHVCELSATSLGFPTTSIFSYGNTRGD